MDITIIVLLITIGIILAFAIAGCVKGFMKMAVSLLSLILTVILVWIVNPYVSDFLKSNTSLYTTIEENCQSYMNDKLSEDITGKDTQASGANYDNPKGGSSQDDSWVNIVNNVVDAAIDQAEDAMAESVTEMAKILGSKLADVILTVITFVVTFVLITLVLKFIFGALNIISRLPVIHTFNKTAGFLLGAGFGIIVVWIIMLLAIALFNTTIGAYIVKSVEENGFMSLLYRLNPLIMLFVK